MEPAAPLVTPEKGDVALLETIFKQQQWKLHTLPTVSSVVEILRKTPAPVVIAELDLALGQDWKDLLDQTRDLPHPPLVVAMSLLADEYLWAEVLNRGGYDVLAKPLCEFEVLWVLRHAFGVTKPAAMTA